VLGGGGRAPSPLVLQVFVAHSARLLGSQPALRPLFVEAVLGLPPAAREALLCVTPWGEFLPPREEALPLSGPSGQRVVLRSVGGALPFAALLAQVHEGVTSSALSYLDPAHFQLLLAAAASALGSGASGGAGAGGAPALPPDFAVLASYPGLRDHLFVGMCDANCNAAALALLRLLLLYLPGGLQLLAANTMQGSVYLLHVPQTGAPDPALKAAVAEFLAEVADAGVEHAAAVRAFLAEWAQRYPQAMADSPLRDVLARLG